MITRNRFNGVRFCHRNRWLLLANGFLTIPEFTLLEFCIDMAFWNNPKEFLGIVEATQEEMANYLGYKNASSVSRPLQSLCKLGFLKQEGKSRLRVVDIKRYLTQVISGGVAVKTAKIEKDITLKDLLDSMHIKNDSNQDDIDCNQGNVDYNQENSKVLAIKSSVQASDSFKLDSSSSILSASWSNKTDSEIEVMLDEIGCTRLMPDDIRLINRIVDGKI